MKRASDRDRLFLVRTKIDEADAARLEAFAQERGSSVYATARELLLEALDRHCPKNRTP